jgi:hypothetical protein
MVEGTFVGARVVEPLRRLGLHVVVEVASQDIIG